MKGKFSMLAVTAAFLCLILGIFIGRNTGGTYVELPKSPPEAELRQESQPAETGGEQETTAEPELGILNINTATKRQLTLLPGIGEALAQRIVDFRDAYGPLQTVEDLLEVKGIGEKKLDAIREYITVGAGG